MKVLFPASEASLQSDIFDRFGRAPGFIVADAESGAFEYLENKEKDGGHGVGRMTAQTVIDSGAEAVAAVQVGPKAMDVLRAAGIRVETGKRGKIADILKEFRG